VNKKIFFCKSWFIAHKQATDLWVHMRKEYFNPHRLETADKTANVSGNYSPFPEFGEYDDLIRKAR
jgi:hypothetical protein